jgi:hypothetical protein
MKEQAVQFIGKTAKTPPYIDYHSFAVFLNFFRASPSELVDMRYLEKTAVTKSAYRMLLMALKSLRLTDSEGKPTLLLTSLLKEGKEFAEGLAQLTKTVYPELLGKLDKGEIAASRKTISQHFQQKYGISIHTAESCASFFIRLARDAELLPNKYIEGARLREPAKGRLDRIELLAIKIALLKKLPNFDDWQPDQVVAVLQQFERLLSYLER